VDRWIRFLSRNRVWVLALLAILVSVVTGYYVKLFEQILRANPGIAFFDVLVKMEYSNFILVFWILAVYLQVKVSFISEDRFARDKEHIIKDMLNSACSLLQVISGDEKLWCIVSKYDKNLQMRCAVYHSDNAVDRPERTCKLPAEFGIAGKAMAARRVVVKNTPKYSSDVYDESTRKQVSEDLRCVVAVPVYDAYNAGGKLYGMVTFGSCKEIVSNGLNDSRLTAAAQKWTDVISKIMRM